METGSETSKISFAKICVFETQVHQAATMKKEMKFVLQIL